MRLHVASVCPDGEQGLSPKESARGELSHIIHSRFIHFGDPGTQEP
ncbi:hypothetical protein KAM338_42850 [Aeromonas caviae]|nr:hypothetical protein KAM330_16300 [Aeromonas hydrophila]GKQ64108.1 hypothetical protein KAM338_42850 [Aeromonas caviae]